MKKIFIGLTALCFSSLSFASDASSMSSAEVIKKIFGDATSQKIKGGGETSGGDGCEFSIEASGGQIIVQDSADGQGGSHKSTASFSGTSLTVKDEVSSLGSSLRDLTISSGNKTTVITYKPAPGNGAMQVRDIDFCGEDL